MRRICLVILVLIILLSLTLQVISLWPGLLSNVLWWVIISGIICVPLLAAAGIVLAVFLIRLFLKSPNAAVRPVLYLAVGGMVFLAALVWIYIHGPLRMAFYITQSSFKPYLGEPIEKGTRYYTTARIGIWNIDRRETDFRGGRYFRIGKGPDGFGPDIISYGFAYRPNKDGSPFGNAKYHLSRLNKDWYFFSASDDW